MGSTTACYRAKWLGSSVGASKGPPGVRPRLQHHPGKVAGGACLLTLMGSSTGDRGLSVEPLRASGVFLSADDVI